ncbi:MAG: hypothetical protein AAFX40_10565, partial [Cyanobacteria bacterium J06639_1]
VRPSHVTPPRAPLPPEDFRQRADGAMRDRPIHSDSTRPTALRLWRKRSRTQRSASQLERQKSTSETLMAAPISSKSMGGNGGDRLP